MTIRTARSRLRYSDHSSQQTRYDADSHVESTLDPNGLVTRFQTDPVGRITKAQVDRTSLNPQFTVEGASLTTWAYDGAGRCIQSTNDFCSRETRYDSLHRPILETHVFSSPLSDTAQPHVVSRTFYPSNTLETLTYPSTRRVEVQRDQLDQPIEIDNQSLGNAYPGKAVLPADKVISTFEYQGKRRRRAVGGNGAQILYSRDKEGRVIETQHQDGAGQTFLIIQQLYDAAGRVRFKNDLTPAASASEDYKYDSEYQLTSLSSVANRAAFLPATFSPYAIKPPDPVPNTQSAIDALIGSLSQLAGPATWQYDLSGNRAFEQKAAQPAQPFVSNPLNQLTNARGRGAIYDLNGNLIQLGNRSYTYDSQNRLVRVSDPAIAQDLVYLHDADGRRVLERTQNAVRRLYYNGAHLIEEYENGALLCQYVHDDLPDHTVHIAANKEDGWFHAELTGSIRAITDRAGNVIAQYTYDPFGVPDQLNGALANRLLFAGKRQDDDSGGYDFRARHYDPSLGRFHQRDPLGWKDGVNLYLYAGNDPLGFIDPLGTERINVNFRPSSFEQKLHLGRFTNHQGNNADDEPSILRLAVTAGVEFAATLATFGAYAVGKMVVTMTPDFLPTAGDFYRKTPPEFAGRHGADALFALVDRQTIGAQRAMRHVGFWTTSSTSILGAGIGLAGGVAGMANLRSPISPNRIATPAVRSQGATGEPMITVRKTVPVEELHFIRNSGLLGKPGGRTYFTLPRDMQGLRGFGKVSERLTLNYPGSTFRDTAVEFELQIPNRQFEIGQGTQGGLGWTEGGAMDLTNGPQPASFIQRFRIHHPSRTTNWIVGNPFE